MSTQKIHNTDVGGNEYKMVSDWVRRTLFKEITRGPRITYHDVSTTMLLCNVGLPPKQTVMLC